MSGFEDEDPWNPGSSSNTTKVTEKSCETGATSSGWDEITSNTNNPSKNSNDNTDAWGGSTSTTNDQSKGNNDNSGGWGGSTSNSNNRGRSNNANRGGWGGNTNNRNSRNNDNNGGWGGNASNTNNRNNRNNDNSGGWSGSTGNTNNQSKGNNDTGDAWGGSTSTTNDQSKGNNDNSGGWGGSTSNSNNRGRGNNANRGGWGGHTNNRNNRNNDNNDSWGGNTSNSNDHSKGSNTNTDAWGGSTSNTNDQSKGNNDTGDAWGGSTSNTNNQSRGNNDNGGGWDGGASNTNDPSKGNDDDTMKNEERPAPYKPDQLDLAEEAELQAADAGENFHRYKDQKVTCVPMDIVKPIEKFEDVIESKLLLGNLKTLRYSEMTPIQKWAMPAIMAGHDIIGCAQTGSGKTAAFLLPILQTILKTEREPHDPNDDCQHPFCLIVSPTRELAKQIYTHAEILSKDSIIKCRVIYGQISTSYLKAQMSNGCHILVATLGRLKDFLERGWVDFKNIKYVILDEGDRLVDERSTGDIRAVFDHPTMPPKDKRQTLFFSATFKEGIQHNAKEYLNDNFMFLAVGRVGAANEDIKQEFMQVTRPEKKKILRDILKQVPEDEKTIVFTQTKHTADILAAFFTSLKLESTSIHGDRHQSQREEAISLFRRGKKRFLISSPVGNRGLDLPKVALVINYDLPENIDEYVHRIGRTGRAGHTGRAISFYDAERDRDLLPDLLRILKDAKQEIPDWLTEQSDTSCSADYSFSEKRPADDDAGNYPKKHDAGELRDDPVAREDELAAPPAGGDYEEW